MAKTCPACAEPLPPEAKFCLHCGESTTVAYRGGAPPEGSAKKGGLSIVLVIVGVLAVGIVVLAVVAAIAIPNLLAAKLSANETAAIATLRNLTACQAQVQISGKIDVDGDEIGEYATILEMTGSAGVRRGPGKDWSKKGSAISPAILSPALALVTPEGVVTKSGYAFVIFLPDASGKGWVHEKGPAAAAALTGPVGTDAAEQRWCAYAWPIARGNSGNRCFFVNESGNIFQSANSVAKHQGAVGPPPPESAFAAGKREPKMGQSGNDGDVWKIVN